LRSLRGFVHHNGGSQQLALDIVADRSLALEWFSLARGRSRPLGVVRHNPAGVY
jgi:hypothetical protein